MNIIFESLTISALEEHLGCFGLLGNLHLVVYDKDAGRYSFPSSLRS